MKEEKVNEKKPNRGASCLLRHHLKGEKAGFGGMCLSSQLLQESIHRMIVVQAHGQKARPYFQYNQSKTEWRCGSRVKP
jgi:hypothetical protein